MTRVLTWPEPTLWERVRAFLRLFVPLGLLLVAIGAGHFYANYRLDRETTLQTETLNVDLARRTVAKDVGDVVSDLRFLADHMSRQGLFVLDPDERRRRVTQEFEVFAERKRIYAQIRFIDSDGLERVRVNFRDGRTEVVPAGALQDKSRRYYVNAALAIRPGQVYVSPLDLNIENGVIERPFQPMLRFATSVHDLGGVRRGMVVLNYAGRRLIDDLKRAAINIADHIQLVNADGYWLSSPRPEDEWGFMLGYEATLGRDHPDVWRQMHGAEQGQMESPAGLFTFAAFYPHAAAQGEGVGSGDAASAVDGKALPSGQAGRWWIVSHLPRAAVAITHAEFFRRHWLPYASLLLLLGVAAGYFVQVRFRHRALEIQAASEARLRSTLEDVGLAVVTLDDHGSILYSNRFFQEQTCWTAAELWQHDWFDLFIPGAQRTGLRSALLQPEPGASIEHIEIEVSRRDGTRCLLVWDIALEYAGGKYPVSMTMIGRDITEQRAIQDQFIKLARAVEQSPSVVTITDRNGVIEYVNPKFTALTGYSAEEIVGLTSSVLKSGEASPEHYQELWATIKSGREWRGEFHNRKKNGELYWEAASISPIRSAEGEITHFVAVKEDITERKRLEAEVSDRNRELAESKVLAALGRMASMIAHDLRNPLSSVKMTLQILDKQAALDANNNELVRIALDRVHYLEHVLNELLTYARPEDLHLQWLNIDKLLDGAVGLAQKVIDEHEVKVVTMHQNGLPTLNGDDVKLRQVFANLISNAAEATGDQPVAARRVVIRSELLLDDRGPRIRVTVCDNGRGIDPDHRGQLFEPFFTTNAQGTGLGLAIVKRIVEQHGGQVDLEPRAEGGTCAVVRLPLNPAAANGEPRDDEAGAPQPGSRSDFVTRAR